MTGKHTSKYISIYGYMLVSCMYTGMYTTIHTFIYAYNYLPYLILWDTIVDSLDHLLYNAEITGSSLL